MAKQKVSKKDTASKLEGQRQRQAEIIQNLRRTNRWILWAAAILIFFLLLGMLIMGYASNWWQDPQTNDRTSQFEADAGQGNSTGADQSGQSTTGTRSTGSTTTTNNTTTNNTTNPDNSVTPPKTALEILLEEIALGDNINDIKARADELGLSLECHNTLIAIQECEFSDGTNTITTKNLITGDSITGILNNLN